MSGTVNAARPIRCGSRYVGRALVLLVCVGTAGCPQAGDVFVCATDRQCAEDGVGACEGDGYCSFPDGACESGRQYGDLAPEALSGTCVPPGASENLIGNPDFESDLGGWFGYQADLSRVEVPHTLDFSCQVCPASEATEFVISDRPNSVASPLAGEVYEGQVWMRAREGDPPLRGFIKLREISEAGEYGEESLSAIDDIGATWSRIAVQHTMTAGAAWLDVYAGRGGDGCFLVDDFALRRITAAP